MGKSLGLKDAQEVMEGGGVFFVLFFWRHVMPILLISTVKRRIMKHFDFFQRPGWFCLSHPLLRRPGGGAVFEPSSFSITGMRGGNR